MPDKKEGDIIPCRYPPPPPQQFSPGDNCCSQVALLLDLPEIYIWLWSLLEAPKWAKIPEMEPELSPPLLLIDLSPFPGPLTHLGAPGGFWIQAKSNSQAYFDLP